MKHILPIFLIIAFVSAELYTVGEEYYFTDTTFINFEPENLNFTFKINSINGTINIRNTFNNSFSITSLLDDNHYFTYNDFKIDYIQNENNTICSNFPKLSLYIIFSKGHSLINYNYNIDIEPIEFINSNNSHKINPDFIPIMTLIFLVLFMK